MQGLSFNVATASKIWPGCNYPEHTIATVSATTGNNVMTNCDMLKDPAGNIKAVAWSKKSAGTTTSSVIGTPTSLAPMQAMFTPRIEAMSQYNSATFPAPAKYQIGVCFGSPTTRQVYGYNDIQGTTAINISAPAFPGSTHRSLGSCVSAGTGIGAPTSGHIGNDRYHVGFFPWQTAYAYTRAINAATGGYVVPLTVPQYYTVNCTSIVYPFDVFAGLAISNCSNSGDDKLAAWCNGPDVVYKETVNSVDYKVPPQGGDGGAAMRVGQAMSGPLSYTITDVSGRILTIGKAASISEIEMGSLPQGVYLLHTQGASGAATVTRFVKQ